MLNTQEIRDKLLITDAEDHVVHSLCNEVDQLRNELTEQKRQLQAFNEIGIVNQKRITELKKQVNQNYRNVWDEKQKEIEKLLKQLKTLKEKKEITTSESDYPVAEAMAQGHWPYGPAAWRKMQSEMEAMLKQLKTQKKVIAESKERDYERDATAKEQITQIFNWSHQNADLFRRLDEKSNEIEAQKEMINGQRKRLVAKEKQPQKELQEAKKQIRTQRMEISEAQANIIQIEIACTNIRKQLNGAS